MRRMKILCAAAFILLMAIPSNVSAKNRATNEIMNDSSIVGRAAVCRPEKSTQEFGQKMGSALAQFYMKKYPNLDRNEILNAMVAGMGFGAAEQEKKGKAECSAVVPEANKVLKKVGSRLRF